MDDNMTALIKQIEKIIVLLKQRMIDDSDKLILRTLYNRYVKAEEILTNNGDINRIMIAGGCRAYLDSFSDYMNPLLDEMYHAEMLLSNIKEVTYQK